MTSVFGCCRKDPDPEGAQLAAAPDPLGEATKLLQKLKQHAADRCRGSSVGIASAACACSSGEHAAAASMSASSAWELYESHVGLSP